MAAPVTMAASLLLMALCTHCIVPAGSIIIPSSCCISFISKKVPERLVINYQLSNSSVCPKAGVIPSSTAWHPLLGAGLENSIPPAASQLWHSHRARFLAHCVNWRPFFFGVFSASSLVPVSRHCVSLFRPSVIERQGWASPI
ncbi:C-C motif chemokine 24 isoform X3 [Kogia breviceps]